MRHSNPFSKTATNTFFQTMDETLTEMENQEEDVEKIVTVREWSRHEKRMEAMDGKLDFLISLLKNNSIGSLVSLADSSITSSSFQRVNSTGSVVSEDGASSVGSAPGSIISLTEQFLQECDKYDKEWNDKYDHKNHIASLENESYFASALNSKFPAWKSIL